MPTLKFRRGTTSQWAAQTRDIAAGEPVLNTETGELKVGDGTNTLWANLKPYLASLLIKDDGTTVSVGDTTNLGSTSGNSRIVHAITGRLSSVSRLLFKHLRIADGSTWTTAQLSIEHEVDGSEKGHLRFGPSATDSTQRVAIGHGSSEALTVNSSGAVQSLFQDTGTRTISGSSKGRVSSAIYSRQSVSGEWTGDSGNWCPLNYFSINTDSVVSSAKVVGAHVIHQFGTSSEGSRNAFVAELIQTGTTGNTSANKTAFFCAANFTARAGYSEGGTAGNERGMFFGINPQTIIGAGATNIKQAAAVEYNVECLTGSSVREKALVTLVNTPADRVKGSAFDAMFIAATAKSEVVGETTARWDYGIAFGRPGSQWPIESDGTILGTYREVESGAIPSGVEMQAGFGVDLRDVEFTDSAFASKNFSVKPSGTVSARSIRKTSFDPVAQFPAYRATIDLDFIDDSGFVSGQAGGSSTSFFTFARGSAGGIFDSAGGRASVATNTPRLDFDPSTKLPKGILIEGACTNLLLNTATPANQDVTVTAQSYTISFYGSGSVTLSGAYSTTLTGSVLLGVRTEHTFTPSAGTLSIAFSGTVTYPQIETGDHATSYVVSTGTAGTRSKDNAYFDGAQLTNWFSQTTGTFYVEFSPSAKNSTQKQWRVFGSNGNHMGLFINATPEFKFATDSTGQATLPSPLTSEENRFCGAYASSRVIGAINGALGTQDITASLQSYTQIRLGGEYNGTLEMDGWIRRFVYWPFVLDDWKMQHLTDR